MKVTFNISDSLQIVTPLTFVSHYFLSSVKHKRWNTIYLMQISFYTSFTIFNVFWLFVRNRSKSPRLKSHFWSCFSNPTGNYLHSGVKRKLELNWSGPTERKIISLRLKGDVLFLC